MGHTLLYIIVEVLPHECYYMTDLPFATRKQKPQTTDRMTIDFDIDEDDDDSRMAESITNKSEQME